MKSNPIRIEKLARTGERIDLSSQQLNQVVALALRAFGAGMTEQEVVDHVLPVDVLYLAHHNGDIAAFASLKFHPDHAYLAGTVVNPAFQGSGIYHDLALHRIRATLEHTYSVFTTCTQNPVVEYTLRRTVQGMQERNEIAGFSMEREYKPALYGRMLTAVRPYSKEEQINGAYNALNYPVGDAFKLTCVIHR